MFECYTFCLPEGEQCLGYPVPGRDNDTAAGRRAYNIVWYRPTDPATTLVDLCTDAAGRNHGMAIPPPLIRPEVIAAIKATARALVAPQIAEIFVRSEPFFQPIFDLELPRPSRSARRWRVACSATPPSWRARMSAPASPRRRSTPPRSPMRWSRTATISPPRSRAIDREQTRFGRGLVGLAREEGAYISAQLKPPHERRGAELPRDIHSLMAAHHASRDRVRRLAAERG